MDDFRLILRLRGRVSHLWSKQVLVLKLKLFRWEEKQFYWRSCCHDQTLPAFFSMQASNSFFITQASKNIGIIWTMLKCYKLNIYDWVKPKVYPNLIFPIQQNMFSADLLFKEVKIQSQNIICGFWYQFPQNALKNLFWGFTFIKDQGGSNRGFKKAWWEI